MALKFYAFVIQNMLQKYKKALLTKKHNLELNKQLYANDSSFLLNVY